MAEEESDEERDEWDFNQDALLDSLRLRTALLLACMELTGGDDLLEAWALAEDFYDAAPALLKELSEQGLKNLPDEAHEFFKALDKQAENN